MKLNDNQVQTVRTAALQVIDSMVAILKECNGDLTLATYIKEKIKKANGWMRIAEEHCDDVLKEAGIL